MTDDHKALTLDLLGLAAVALDDPIAQAAALLTAATVIIEREFGTANARAALNTLLEPTLIAWGERTPNAGAAHQPGGSFRGS